MKVKATNPDTASGLIDPVTNRSPFVNQETKALIAEVEVPESTFWIRRLTAGEIVRVTLRKRPETPPADEPTGLEPVTPITTR